MELKSFHCLYNSGSDSFNLNDRILGIKEACVAADLECHFYDQQKVDFSRLPKLTYRDALFNCARGSRLLECTMLNEEVLSLYQKFPGTSVYRDSNQLNIILERRGIRTPKTIHCGNNNRDLLRQYVDFVNGYPLIIKTFGGSGGVGTMVVESYQALISLCDYLFSQKTEFLLKEFIPSDGVYRVTVINGKIVSAFKKTLGSGDLRTDGIKGQIDLTPLTDRSVIELAIEATKQSNLYMAGVDIILDERNRLPYVLEVNLPANFYQEGVYSGVPIYHKMIDFFMKHPRLK